MLSFLEDIYIFTTLAILFQAIEFFFFAASIVALSILFATMSFFYKYVDLSNYGQTTEDPSAEPEDEDSALMNGESSKPLENKRNSYTTETPPTPHSESEM